MRQDQFFDIGFHSQLGSLTRRQMRELASHFCLFVCIGGFDHQCIRVPAEIEQVICPAGIAYHDKLDTFLQRTQHIVWLDVFAVGQSDLVPGDQVAAFGTERDTQRVGFFRQEGPARFPLEDISQAVGTAMSHRKCADCKIIRFEEQPGLELVQAQRHGSLVAPQDNTVQQIMDAVEGGPPGKDIEFLNRFPTQKGAEQPAQSEDVIEMTMRQKNACEIFETDTRLQDLTLCALTAVDQKTVLIMFDDLGGKPALCRRRGSGSTKEEYFEQS
jgi:hypothetical protein